MRLIAALEEDLDNYVKFIHLEDHVFHCPCRENSYEIIARALLASKQRRPTESEGRFVLECPYPGDRNASYRLVICYDKERDLNGQPMQVFSACPQGKGIPYKNEAYEVCWFPEYSRERGPLKKPPCLMSHEERAAWRASKAQRKKRIFRA